MKQIKIISICNRYENPIEIDFVMQERFFVQFHSCCEYQNAFSFQSDAKMCWASFLLSDEKKKIFMKLSFCRTSYDYDCCQFWQMFYLATFCFQKLFRFYTPHWSGRQTTIFIGYECVCVCVRGFRCSHKPQIERFQLNASMFEFRINICS